MGRMAAQTSRMATQMLRPEQPQSNSGQATRPRTRLMILRRLLSIGRPPRLRRSITTQRHPGCRLRPDRPHGDHELPGIGKPRVHGSIRLSTSGHRPEPDYTARPNGRRIQRRRRHRPARAWRHGGGSYFPHGPSTLAAGATPPFSRCGSHRNRRSGSIDHDQDRGAVVPGRRGRLLQLDSVRDSLVRKGLVEQGEPLHHSQVIRV